MNQPRQSVEIYVGGALVYASGVREGTLGACPVHSAKDAVEHLASIRRMPQEVFVVMSLNGANLPIRTRCITVGLLDSNQVHPREVFAEALVDRAAAIVVAHNHPSGTLEASPEDLALTSRLQKAGDLLGVRVLDHVIVTSDGFISLRQLGKM